MFKKFYINSILFKIDNFEINIPLNIKTLENTYLSCHVLNNIVDFYFEDDNSGRQQWIIEKDDNEENVYYIKCVFNRYNFTQYLGCPNKNNQVYLYTSKNKYTKWHITNVKNNIYKILYYGEKFNQNDVCLVVARYIQDIEWTLPYNDITIIYNKGNVINLPFNDVNIFNNIKILDNIGNEEHTFLYHIINNYNNLTNRCIFVNGCPFVNNETVLFGIDNYYKTLDVQPLGLQYFKKINIPPSEILEEYKIKTDYGLNYCTFNIDNNCDFYAPCFYDSRVKIAISNYNRKFYNCKSLIDNFLIRSKFPNIESINNIKFTFGGIFIVIKEKIINYDISIYNNLLNELINCDPLDKENSFILQRLWLFIF